jgi:hypothetical protein
MNSVHDRGRRLDAETAMASPDGLTAVAPAGPDAASVRARRAKPEPAPWRVPRDRAALPAKTWRQRPRPVR